MLTDLDALEKQCCKENFEFYDKEKQGWVERFELQQLLSICGYHFTDEKIK